MTFTLQDYLEGFKFTTTFNLQVKPQPIELTFSGARKPFFELKSDFLIEYRLKTGEPWNFDLPEAKHPIGDSVDVAYSSVELKKAKDFVNYDESG